MNILKKVKEDQLKARKGLINKSFNSYLTTLIAEIEIVAKNDGNRLVNDNDSIKVIEKFKKGVSENIKLLKDSEKIVELEEELKLYESYLPQQLSYDELRLEIASIIVELGINSMKGMGLIMKRLKENFNGRFDGNVANSLIKELLS
jgi:uncharacterized protein YqeY